MSGLRIAEGVHLPVEYVTKTAAICAQRRKGKTYTASVIAEELYAQNLPWVVLDPTGAWWGLRAAADGLGYGLQVVILGGDHGDLPLDRHSGRAIADLVVDHPSWYVLDLSLLETRAAEREFAADFAERLYRRKSAAEKRFPLHLFVDEADMFAPQEKEAGDNKMLGAFQAIVRRGGILGLGCTLITQRPALLNKSVLTQLDLLILLRLVAGNDQDAVDKNYVKRAGSPEERSQLMGSLASLAVGEAWLWEPGAEPPLFERARIRERHTFNSSATPKVGEQTVLPKRWAEVDLAAVKDQLAESIKRAERDDPELLRRYIRELERDLTAAQASHAQTVEVEVEVPVVPASVPIAFDGAVQSIDRAIEQLQVTRAFLADQHELLSTKRPQAAGATTVISGRVPDPEHVAATVAETIRRPLTDLPPSGEKMGKPEKSILTVLAQFPDGKNRRQVAALAGLKASGGHFGNTLSKLRTKGWIVGEGEGPFRATPAGVEALGTDYTPLPRGEALLDWWLAQLGRTHQAVLRELVAVWPRSIERAALADLVGVDAGGGHFGNILSHLRTRDLITGKGELRADDDFMAAIRA